MLIVTVDIFCWCDCCSNNTWSVGSILIVVVVVVVGDDDDGNVVVLLLLVFIFNLRESMQWSVF